MVAGALIVEPPSAAASSGTSPAYRSCPVGVCLPFRSWPAAAPGGPKQGGRRASTGSRSHLVRGVDQRVVRLSQLFGHPCYRPPYPAVGADTPPAEDAQNASSDGWLPD